MTLKEQVFAQAALLAGQLDARQRELLRILCVSSVTCLESRLREGLKPEDCKADFIAAASLYALSALNGIGDGTDIAQLKVGDVTLHRGGADAASNCLRNQAELMIAPYLKDRCSFRGV